MMVIMAITVFWDVMLCSLVDAYSYFGGMYCFHLQEHGKMWYRHRERDSQARSLKQTNQRRDRVPEVTISLLSLLTSIHHPLVT
jgi:hypothetical protein